MKPGDIVTVKGEPGMLFRLISTQPGPGDRYQEATVEVVRGGKVRLIRFPVADLLVAESSSRIEPR